MKSVFVKTLSIKSRATENQGRDAVNFHSWLKIIYDKGPLKKKQTKESVMCLKMYKKTQRKLLVKRKMEIFPKAITTKESHVATDLDHM